jgi:hypothetical protein
MAALALLPYCTGCGGVTKDDSVTRDASTDTADAPVVNDTPISDACVPGAREAEACGTCGTHSRDCLPSGEWSDFTKCESEVADPECALGASRTVDCGNCGTRTDTCNSITCTWKAGACLGEGECTPGDVETLAASCTAPGKVRSRTCSSKCRWGDFSDCS